MKKRMFLAAALILPLMAMAQADEQRYVTQSPGKNVELTFYMQDGRPTYELTYKGKAYKFNSSGACLNP